MKLKFKKTLLLICSCFCLTGILAQTPQPAMENYFSEIAKLRQLNGNILLAKDGQTLFKKSFGYADFETRQPNTAASHFNLASISKLFTSTAILQLRDKGKLSLDDKVVKYIADFPYPDISIRHLLTHTSGLPNFELFEDIVHRYPDTVITNKDVFAELKKWKGGLYFKPGDKYEYNNVGYSLLAMLVEKIASVPFEQYLQRNIFEPSGMNDTYLSLYPNHTYKQDASCVKMHAMPHPYYDTTYLYVDSLSQYKYTDYNCSGMIGGTNIITTTADLLRFDKAFFDGRLIKPATMEEAFTPVKLNNGETYYGHMDTMDGEGKGSCGLGWDIFDQPGFGRSVGHGGFYFGLATFYFHNLSTKQTIISFDNTAGSEFGRIITSSLYLLNDKAPMVIRRHHSLAFVYGSTLVKEGPDAAASAFNTVKNDTAHYYLSEWEFNKLGGNMMFRSTFKGHQTLALEVFKINTLLFPDSFNTYDSYGEGLREVGLRQQAILMFQKSITMNPDNENGKTALKELLEGH